ncbi:LysR substrate-binding domain-containing protein [Acinetobacter haemolyticus]|uniref:LysR substrate-binding domain-containing protein n=1 Tax=Acinetobacter haemolyticus TaxID=29430 RepID=UPI003AF664EC
MEKKTTFQNDHISLNWLKTFDVAARVNSFKLAADQLCITPSAVSQQIKELETALGTKLFNRKSHGLYLNETGEKYWREVKRGLNIIRLANDKLRFDNHQFTLKISLIPPIANNIIFPALLQFNQLYPDIKLNFEVTEKLVDLSTSDIDIAIRYSSPPWDDCDYEVLTPVTVQPVCSELVAHRLDLITNPNNIINAPLIHMSNTPGMWPEFLKVMGLQRTNRTNDIYVNDYQTAMGAVLSQGVAMVLYSIEKPFIKQQNLIALPNFQLPFGTVYAVTTKGRLQEKSIRIFLDWIKKLIEFLE